MRTREVMVHAVDLDTGIQFTDLPEEFITNYATTFSASAVATPSPPSRAATPTSPPTWQAADTPA
ncbi:hypothetical protein ACFPH6_20225 [Streptomyces xiangluensis]|uniref:Uncharacterized protein n=1 Tax=Streptomyces xiangluensis TaxID=2665720 RepID=A0ABV8YNH6_9ACTN